MNELVEFLERIPGEVILLMIGFIALCALVAMIVIGPPQENSEE